MFVRALFLIVAMLGGRAAANLCPDPNLRPLRQRFGKLVMSSGPHRGNDLSFGGCDFRVVGPDGKVIAQGGTLDGDLAVDPPWYLDLDGDGFAELVIRTDSGGSGGYRKTYIISEKPQPRLVAKFTGQCPMRLVDLHRDGRIEMATCDRDFDAEFCNACNPIIWVYLRLEHGSLRDVSSEFAAVYDRDIAERRRRLDGNDLQQFLRATDKAQMFVGPGEPAASIMTVVLDYLYSGRDEQAWQALRAMWPKWDQDRVHEELLRARRQRVLRNIGQY